MTIAHLVRSSIGAASLLCLMGTATPAAAFSSVVAFGDSLSDTGNLLALTSSLPQFFPVALPQADDYWQGRFSNGPVAVEVLAQGLGVPLFNFAFGGAKSGQDGQAPNTGLLAQVGLYSNVVSGAADANALHVVWGGANDLRDATLATAEAVIGQTVLNLVSVVGDLYGMGARQFLLPNLPDLGLTPEVLSTGAPEAVIAATTLSVSFNSVLANAYGQLLSLLPGAQFHYFDTFLAQHALTNTVGQPGSPFTNAVEGCFTGYVGTAGDHCGLTAFDGAGHIYWDKVHPTAATHGVLGNMMLAAVPEPATVLSMGLGVLLLLGLSARRRRG